ncbi:TPA: type II toxin-antitoxin system PemK/MazF family toxin [Streptococcus suis]|uniref:Type II toxin-antitoxin system PemK/MazF family toxin n=1 Tax=Streptococcus suis TaxID=1307 RepID=A0AB37G1N1_STRSU|nr:type II toxin-antitoxin system PemK/MazF family toxin [Streptococcus suis]MCB2913679.1 type II toxin-antitoxin system PemK/MazF family toxin [Streptococcus suis]MCB2919497.1 type II toxin-antitoxin system PemK/MazF family toxin [Streptococcus suis]MCB2940031.1 type II toxin-antitoxin system PemK/MazF family toxin [Streptococcus suis]MCQ8268958.1 type II toxin-antitoxin system PemK/MazF family toxin [Streptococcus suis]MDW8659106.1 type II toxin-antitoxin system PemK/MazF family toxin [Strep
MASGRTNDEIALYVAQTITELEEYLHHLTKNGDPDDARADKISQWVESWTKYLKQEKKFNPRSIPAFKRGSIVYVDLGFNVGTEYGGIHYAIVLNKKDSRNNTLLHILPLTSIKETTDVDNLKYYQLSLSNEIHRLLIQKAQNNIKLIAEKKIIFEEKQEKINQKIAELKSILKDQVVSEDLNPRFEEYFENELSIVTSEQQEIDKIVRDMTAQSEYLEKLINKIKNLKMGSIALLNQVTTISKLRLLDPINKKSLLTDITLSAETLDIIDDALKNIL